MILSEVPELNDWNSKHSYPASWIELIQKTRNLGLETNYIINAGLKFNPENSSTFILRVSTKKKVKLTKLNFANKNLSSR